MSLKMSLILKTGGNPTILSYNAIVVKNYNASSLVRFGTKFFTSTLKRTLVYYNAGVVHRYIPSCKVNSRMIDWL
jgi:hypothetical protein